MIEAEVVITALCLDPRGLGRCERVLAPGELRRADRYLRPADRARFVASHAALRLVLGRALGLAPAALRFSTEPSGRPAVAGIGTDLDFNLSHSGDLALIGMVPGVRIGVDVEVLRPLPDALRIARGHFAPDEADALAGLPPHRREDAFFELWTRKEAVVKALGTGLSLPLKDFSVSTPPAPARLLRIAGGAWPWTLAEIAVGPGARATAGVAAAPARIRTTWLPPDWADNFDAN